MNDVYIVGAGIHPFGRTPSRSGLDQGVYAVRRALEDADLQWRDVECAYGGSDSAGKADVMVNQLGLTTLQFTNVLNGCATGGAALSGAYNAIKAGADIALAVGFDKHPRGAFDPRPSDWGLPEWFGETGMMLTTQFFALKLRRYMEDFGISTSSLALIAQKAFRNGSLAEHAWRREPIDINTILQSTMVNDPLTKYMFCSPSEGAAAIVLTSARKAREIGRAQVRLLGVVVRTRPPGVFEVFSPSLDVTRGFTPTQVAARKIYEDTGVGPAEIDVAQLQDTDSGSEIMHMAENGFCSDGEQEKWLAEGATTLTGELPINTDGGCLACGEPIGASGLRQIYENVLQLRGVAGARQVESPVTAYSHVQGAPGLACVTIMQR